MYAPIILALLCAGPDCLCPDGCNCPPPCRCVTSVKRATANYLPSLLEGAELAAERGGELVCYVGDTPRRLEPRRPGRVYCRARGLLERPGTGLLEGHSVGTEAESWVWFADKPKSIYQPLYWGTVPVYNIQPYFPGGGMPFMGGCAGGACGGFGMPPMMGGFMGGGCAGGCCGGRCR